MRRIVANCSQKVPFIGNYFTKEVHPADNVSLFGLRPG